MCIARATEDTKMETLCSWSSRRLSLQGDKDVGIRWLLYGYECYQGHRGNVLLEPEMGRTSFGPKEIEGVKAEGIHLLLRD